MMLRSLALIRSEPRSRLVPGDDPIEPRDITHEIKFLVLILGARTPPPKIEAPVTKIPLLRISCCNAVFSCEIATFVSCQLEEEPGHTILLQRPISRYTTPRLVVPKRKARTLRGIDRG